MANTKQVSAKQARKQPSEESRAVLGRSSKNLAKLDLARTAELRAHKTAHPKSLAKSRAKWARILGQVAPKSLSKSKGPQGKR
jgi:hypothetical protein